MRRKIRLDWTGLPPGELMTMATDFALDIENAFSIGPASVDSERPGRSGAAMPIAPESFSTGTTVLRLNQPKHMLSNPFAGAPRRERQREGIGHVEPMAKA